MEQAMRERIIPLVGGHNFRDIGGYRTADGRETIWGSVYRSGTMAGLEDADLALLKTLGLRVICDLRTTGERSRKPSRLPLDPDLEVWSYDYETSTADLAAALTHPDTSAAVSRTKMIELYQHLAHEQAPGYRVLFQRLAAGTLPIVFHCAAGKDRTGIAAAILLDLLGVPRDIVIEDYLLTNRFFERSWELVCADPWIEQLTDVDPKIWAPVMLADADYLAAMFLSIEARHGSVESFVREALGLSEDAIASIRARLLT